MATNNIDWNSVFNLISYYMQRMCIFIPTMKIVYPVPHLTHRPMSCWAATAATLALWRDGKSLDGKDSDAYIRQFLRNVQKNEKVNHTNGVLKNYNKWIPVAEKNFDFFVSQEVPVSQLGPDWKQWYAQKRDSDFSWMAWLSVVPKAYKDIWVIKVLAYLTSMECQTKMVDYSQRWDNKPDTKSDTSSPSPADKIPDPLDPDWGYVVQYTNDLGLLPNQAQEFFSSLCGYVVESSRSVYSPRDLYSKLFLYGPLIISGDDTSLMLKDANGNKIIEDNASEVIAATKEEDWDVGHFKILYGIILDTDHPEKSLLLIYDGGNALQCTYGEFYSVYVRQAKKLEEHEFVSKRKLLIHLKSKL